MQLDKGSSDLIRFRSSDLPERDRVPFWSDFLAKQVVHCVVAVPSDVPYHAKRYLNDR
jgi:hypothetical protein